VRECVGAVDALRTCSGDLLFHHPAAHEAAAAESCRFLDSLKEGDKVVTSGGIYGTITKIGEQALKLEVADRVRIDVSRNAIVGYQGQAPVATDGSGSSS
jgi:preprotein translocase YajC subunit